MIDIAFCSWGVWGRLGPDSDWPRAPGQARAQRRHLRRPPPPRSGLTPTLDQPTSTPHPGPKPPATKPPSHQATKPPSHKPPSHQATKPPSHQATHLPTHSPPPPTTPPPALCFPRRFRAFFAQRRARLHLDVRRPAIAVPRRPLARAGAPHRAERSETQT